MKNRNLRILHINDIHSRFENLAKIATDYLQRGSGYLDLVYNRNVRYNADFMREVLIKYLPKEEMLKLAFNKRFIVKEDKRSK